MSSPTQTVFKTAGLILLIVGIGLAVWGYQLSGSVAAKFTRGLTGALPDGVMYRYLAGGASAAAGIFLLLKR
jgi:hypothetical protein